MPEFRLLTNYLLRSCQCDTEAVEIVQLLKTTLLPPIYLRMNPN